MHKSITLVVSIDGVAPRFINPATMPTLCDLAHVGASCFQAQTVVPSVTLPAHASMLLGVSPLQHGIVSNENKDISCTEPSFLAHARRAGLGTAACFNWKRLAHLLEDDAVDELFSLDGGYDPEEDQHVVAHAKAILKRRAQQLVFAYISQPDLLGHSDGWGADAYVDALKKSDVLLAKLIASLEPEDSVLVTTDHGGLGDDHELGRAEDMQTFVVVRSPMVKPKSYWETAAIVDTAPTVASLCGLPAHPGWTGKSLIGQEKVLTDVLLDALRTMQEHAYGERINMQDHCLLSAAAASSDHAEDSMIVACLLHDIGHIMGDAGHWGLPSHAEVGATALQQILPPEIVEPIRAHVEAKRYLVSFEPAYADVLSEASMQSLREQGGAMNESEMRSFESNPYFNEALALRRYDDSGKSIADEAPSLASFEALLNNCLATSPVLNPRWVRDACQCNECRSSDNGQHLLNVSDLSNWHVVASSYSEDVQRYTLKNDDGQLHQCLIKSAAPVNLTKKFWGSEHLVYLQESASRRDDDLSAFFEALTSYGIALVTDLNREQGEVLNFASKIGFVRETNYGRLFDVIAEPDPINLAYTPVGLPLHTDNPYRRPTPTIQLLHCLTAAENGGASHFSDGFSAAEKLRTAYPEYFSTLSETMLTYQFCSDGIYLNDSKPMLQVDGFGKLQAVHLNHRSMQAPDLSAADAEQFYQAYDCYVNLLNDDDARLEITLQAGQLIAFDNRRILHGRAGFSVSEKRHLQGCYIDVDAIDSAARLSLLG